MAVSKNLRRVTSWVAALSVGLLIGAGVGPATADTAPLDPVTTPATVSADGLPTVQIDGVVWSQTVVGRTVYAAGKFTTARPAGSPAGVNTVPRSNLLAYDIETGVLVPGFAPVLNGQATAITQSPDGRRIYVVGDFTQVDGKYRVGVAAFDTATGALVSTFRPTLSSRTLAVAATNDTVYVGGNFTSAASVTGGTLEPRAYLAAFDATTGELRPFRADADAPVTALAVTADGGKVVVGGRFLSLSGGAVTGLGAVDPVSGAPSPFPTNQYVKNAGTKSSITSLYADASGVYGTGYHFGAGGNLEGSFRAHPSTGEMLWVTDCHGDAYSVFPQGDVVYASGHAHYCGNVPGGFPQTEPWTFYHGNAWTKEVRGTNLRDIYGYPDHVGQPAPLMLNWYPTFIVGTYTGQSQATWSVSGNDRYLVMGGEFPGLNGQPQQGLVRFARADVAPNKQGPRISGAAFNPRVTSPAAGTVRVNWRGNWDRDNRTLTYRLYRAGTAAPIHERTVTAPFFEQPTMGFTDTGVAAGSTQQYRITATDPFGNVAQSQAVPVTVAATGGMSPYLSAVLRDQPTALWRLGEQSGTSSGDSAGFDDATTASGVLRGVPGAVPGDGATSFDGTTNGYARNTAAGMGPQTFSVETWVRTTTTSGGKLVGFGNAATGSSTKFDRHLYMDNGGRLYFGVNSGGLRTVTSAGSYNDGRWHHVVATLGPNGMHLFVDGAKVAGRTDTSSAQRFHGYWRIGGDTLSSGWPGTKTSGYLNGALDDVAIYPTALSAETIAAHHAAATTPPPADVAPTARFTSSVSGLTVGFDGAGSTDADGSVVGYAWDFGNGRTGTGASTTHTYAAAGTYPVRLTVTDNVGRTGTTTATVTVTEPVNAAPTATFTSSVSGLAVQVDGSGSKDADGSVRSYRWDFGDGGSATGATVAYAYAAAGTYRVTLTVTDDRGATASTTASVTVTSSGVTELARDAFTREVSGGWGAADLGGTWTHTGGSTNVSATGGTGRHRLPTAGATVSTGLSSVSSTDTDVRVTVALDKAQTGGGTYVSLVGRRVGSAEYSARLRFLADGGVSLAAMHGSTSLTAVTVPGLTYRAGERLQARVQVTGVSPTTIRAKVWRTGATEPADWQVTTTSAASGLQSAGAVGLTSYLSGSSTSAPMVVGFDDLRVTTSTSAAPVNQAPTPAFTLAGSGLQLDVDGSGSVDPDGTVTLYTWSFGDGTSATGRTASRTYAAGGTYTVRLTVTDDAGATGTVTREVTVSAPAGPAALARDAFDREVSGGWGAAETGGAWTLTGGSTNVAVSAGAGLHRLRTAGATVGTALPEVLSSATDLAVTVTPDKPQTGGGTYVSVVGRRVGTAEYAGRLRFLADGKVALAAMEGGTSLSAVTVPGLTHAPGEPLRVRVQVTGVSPTTVRAKVWRAGGDEPTAWQVSATSLTAGLQSAGGVGLTSYLSGSSTSTPMTVAFDDLLVQTP